MRNIYLIGPTASGKSTTASYLANQLGQKYYDSDTYIVNKIGMSIPKIFDTKGEEFFRQCEAKAIKELTKLKGIVLATGGGSVIYKPDNQKILKQNGIVIYLQVSIQEQLLRTKEDKSRPLLQVENPSLVLEKMAIKRNPIYQSSSHYSVSTNNKTIQLIGNEILNLLQKKIA